MTQRRLFYQNSKSKVTIENGQTAEFDSHGHKPKRESLKGHNLIATAINVGKDNELGFIWHGLVADVSDADSSLPIRPVFEELSTLNLVQCDNDNSVAMYKVLDLVLSFCCFC